jgi:aminomethyltransferase
LLAIPLSCYLSLCCITFLQVVKQQLADGVPIRRVGFISAGAPARQHSDITTPEGEVIGEVTSGAFSPCLKKNIAMG